MRDSMVKRLLVATRGTPGDSPDTVEVLVADTGRGVSAEDKERLFLPYFSTKERGTGLGLAIVSHIVGEHGGRIRVEDNRPAGARFYVEIPLTGDAVAPETEIVGSGVRV
jgi:signal transduction histidine kinase